MSQKKHAAVCLMVETPNQPCMRPMSAWWRRGLCMVRGLLLPCDWHHATTLFLRSNKAIAIERQRQITKSSCFPLIHPYSPFHFYASVFIMFVYFASLIYMPMQVFYSCPPRNDAFILFCDTINGIEVILKFFTGFCGKNERVVILDYSKIAVHYIKDTFILDFIACLPLQLFCQPFYTGDCNYPMHTLMYVFKIFRIVTVTRVQEMLGHQLRVPYLAMVFSVVFVRGIMFFHWLTYLHYQISVLLVAVYPRDVQFEAWLKRFKVIEQDDELPTVFNRYISNLYYVVGLCIGTGEQANKKPYTRRISEQLIQTALSILGLMFVIYAEACILRIVLYIHNESNLFEARFKEVQDHARRKEIPKTVQQKINLFLNYRYNGHFFNERAIMKTINQQIKQEINMFCCRKLVARVPLFQDMPIALLNTIIFSFRQVFYMPGQVITKYGKPGSSIYLLASGTVVVMDAEDQEVGHLKDGSYFGERCLLKPGSTRSATVVALEITETFKLSHLQLEQCLQPSSRLKRRLHDIAKRAEESYRPSLD